MGVKGLMGSKERGRRNEVGHFDVNRCDVTLPHFFEHAILEGPSKISMVVLISMTKSLRRLSGGGVKKGRGDLMDEWSEG